jgi:hypothetical protein
MPLTNYLTKKEINLFYEDYPQIFHLEAANKKPKAKIIINPGIATRHLHIKEPFIGYQLAKLNYEIFVINTLDAKDRNNPFERINLTLKAHQVIKEENTSQIPIIGLGHSLGCIDLLRSRPDYLNACIFLSPGFKGDKKHFKISDFFNFIWNGLLDRDWAVYMHGHSSRPELSDYKTDLINPRFLWNLQKYAHGLERKAFWPLNKPCLTWLGSNSESDGIMKLKEPLIWADLMEKLNKDFKLIIQNGVGHEPGWKESMHAFDLAIIIDEWIALKVII